MADLRPKRIAEFIEPFRVARVEGDAGQGLRPRPTRRASATRRRASSSWREGVELLAEYQARLAAQDTLRRARRAAGAGRRRQGRHDPPRHERREPAGRVGPQLQGAVGRGARPRLPLALRRSGCPRRGEIGIFNRSHYEEVLVVRVHPEILERQKLPTAGARAGRLEAPLPRDQRLGALPRRQRLPHREALPQPLEGGAAQPLPAADRPAREELEVLGRRRRGARATGTTTRRRSPRCSPHTSTEWAPWYVIPADHKWFARIAAAAVHRPHADRDRPAVSRR